MLNLIRTFLHLGAIINPLPNNILDGQLIDAVPVMNNFNWIVSQVNANVPALVGNNTFVGSGSVGGTGNAITLAPSPVITAYQQGQTFTFVAAASNTSAVTINTNGLGTRAVKTAFAAQLTGGEIISGGIYTVTDTGTNYVLTNGAQGSGLINFTPTLSFGHSSTGITYSTQIGQGYKVNNLFWFSINVVLTNKGSATGDAFFEGLPYPINSAFSDGEWVCGPSNITITDKFMIAAGVATANFGVFVQIKSAATFVLAQDTDFANNSAFVVTGWYPV